MRNLMIGLGLALALSACATGRGYGGYGGGYGDYAYNGYYDNYYGPIVGGYWGAGDTFYYRTRPDGDWRRDDGRHFRRDAFNGYMPVRVHGPHPNWVREHDRDDRDHDHRPG